MASARRAVFLSLITASVALAGCIEQFTGDADVGSLLATGPQLDHDHVDPGAHAEQAGLEAVGVLALSEALGDEAARLSDLQFQPNGTLAAIAVNGAAGTPQAGGSAGGFLLVDASDPLNLTVVGRYRSGSEDNWYTKFTPDGQHVLLTANGNFDAAAGAATILDSLQNAAPTGALRGIHVVDVSDPAAPALVGFHAVPLRVVNLASWVGPGSETLVAASVIEDRVPVPDTPEPPAEPPGGLPAEVPDELPVERDHVRILRLVEQGPLVQLEELARWQPPTVQVASATDRGGAAFPHDLAVAMHPVTGDTVLYAAYWDAGGFLVNVTAPGQPALLGHLPPWDDGDHVHTVKPHPGLVDGRVYAVAAPETFEGEPSGTYRAYDVTDPRTPFLVAAWRLPPGTIVNDEALVFSPHEFSVADGRVHTSNYHGGVWVLELPALTPVAAWQAAVDGSGRTGSWTPNVATTVWHDGLVYAVDLGGGVVVLRGLR